LPHRLDLVGVAAISGALALVLVPLVVGSGRNWPAWAVAMLVISAPAVALALWHQARLKRRGGEPLLDVDLFRQRSFSVGLAVNMIVYAYIGSFFLAMAVFLQAGLGLSPLRAGLTFAAPALGFALAAVLARPLAARHGRNLVVAALALNCIALVALIVEFELSGSAISAVRIELPLTLTWIGNGLILPTVIGVVLTGVDPRRAGSAAGTLTTGQQFAMAIGVALLGIVFFDHSGGVLTLQDYSSQMQQVFVLDLVLMVASVMLARFLPGAPPPAPVAAPSRA
jgi:MFS family permease